MGNALRKIFSGLRDLFTTPLFKGTEISLQFILEFIILCLVIVALTRFLRKFLKQRVLTRFNIDEGNRDALSTIVSYGAGTLGFLLVIQTRGFNLESLALIAGGLGVGIGFGLQDITKNFVSGLTLLFEGKVKVGDFVEFEGLIGYVKEIAIRSTIIRTREGGDVVVPNRQLVENQLLNWSYDSYKARMHIPVGVAYGSDPVLVTETLLNSAYMEPAVLSTPTPRVLFRGFGSHSLDFELRVWVSQIDKDPDIRSSLNFIIEYNLRQQQIKIPFPQQDLWLRNPEVLMPLVKPDANLPSSSDASRSLERPVMPSAPPSIKSLLKQVTYFQDLTDLELRQLIAVGYRKHLYKSQFLFREGDPGDAFYIILTGSVEVFVEKIDKYLTTLQSGQCFGELALMLGIPRTASVRALEGTNLFAINKQGFEGLLQENPNFSEMIVQAFAKHQEELAERQTQLRSMGLLDQEEDDTSPVVWVRSRLKILFNL